MGHQVMRHQVMGHQVMTHIRLLLLPLRRVRFQSSDLAPILQSTCSEFEGLGNLLLLLLLLGRRPLLLLLRLPWHLTRSTVVSTYA